MIYTIPFRIPVAQLYQIKLEKPEVTGKRRNRGLGAEPTAGGVGGWSPPMMVASVVCPLKTNAGIYRNALHSCNYCYRVFTIMIRI